MRSEGLGWNRERVSDWGVGWGGTITRNCTQCCPTWVFLPFVHVVKFLICLVCIVASFKLSCV